MKWVTLESQRIVLRKFTDTDTEAFYQYRANPDVARYQGWDNYTREQAVAFVQEMKDFKPNIPGTWFQIALARKSDDTLIGDCAIHTLESDPDQVEIGITLDPKYQGQGYATEALQNLFTYIFTVLNKHRIIANTDTRNHSVNKLLENLGMRREGHFLQNAWYKGEYTDEYLYAVLKDEWLRKKS